MTQPNRTNREAEAIFVCLSSNDHAASLVQVFIPVCGNNALYASLLQQGTLLCE